MPKSCCMIGCTTNKLKTPELGFKIPNRKSQPVRREKWIQAIRREASPGMGELWDPVTQYAYVCSKHFVTGRPSALNNVESVDWAPTIHLDYQKGKPVSEVPRKREKMMMSIDDQHPDGAQALLDLHWTNKNIKQEDDTERLHGRQDAGCQTDLTMDDIERMKDALQQTTGELANLKQWAHGLAKSLVRRTNPYRKDS